MPLFKKNPNEVLYPNGKKPFMSVIKNEGSPDALIWKVPYEDFNENSRLIVAEHEEAMFYKNGVIEEIFTGGEFILSTNNYPFLSRIRNMFTDGVSVYNCKVFYVNKAHKLDLRWGTDGPVQVVDPFWDVPTTLVSRGAYTIQVKDAKKFYLKYAGPNVEQLGPLDIVSSFRSPFNQTVKSSLGKIVKAMNDEILGICSRQAEIAEGMIPEISPILDEYGLRLINFYVDALEIADSDSRKLLEAKRAEIAARKKEIEGKIADAQGEKAYLETLGITWTQKESAGILNNLAQNEGNIMATAGAGLGFGVAAGGVFGGMAANMMTSFNQPQQQPVQPAQAAADDRFQPKQESGKVVCPACGQNVNMSKFCSECGVSFVRKCVGCRSDLGAQSKFCQECGMKQE